MSDPPLLCSFLVLYVAFVATFLKDAAGNAASVFYFTIQVTEVDVLSSIYGTDETIKREGIERRALWCGRSGGGRGGRASFI